MFGSTTTPAAGGNIFGASNNQPAASGSGGGLFGSFGQNNTNQQPQQPAQSLFGNAGASNAQQQPTNSLFGNTNANAQQQQPTTSLFGNTNNNAAAGSTGTGTSLFGNNAGGGLFGKPATPAPPAGTNLFGNTNNNAATNTAAPSTGLFGSATTQPAAGSNSFFSTPPAGQQQQQQQQQNANAPKPGTAATGLFGTTSTNPLFGGSNTTGSAPSNTLFGGSSTTGTNPLFGSSTTGTTGTGTLFGNPTAQTASTNAPGSTLFGNTLGASALGSKPSTGLGATLGTSTLGNQAQGADAQVQFARLQEKIMATVGAWDANNPTTCRFQHYFYNLVDPAQVSLYGRPPSAVNEALWQKAVRENPDPSCLVPVLAIGFDQLRERVDAQATQSAAHKERLVDLQKRLETLKSHHTTTTVPRLQRYSALQTQLMHRLLNLVQHLHLLIPSVRSSAIGEHEEALRGALEEAVSEVGLSGSANSNGEARGGRGGKLKSKLGELWAVIGALKAREESLAATMGTAGEWKVVDEEGLARITQILAEQQAGLAHLTKILKKDLKDLAIIMGSAGSGGVVDDEDEKVFGASLRGSTLRASALR
ncbi:Nucleoporin nup57 [Stygiomarasmius scandens]|uniref:Nucleoporin nup57 n=1 Tax=Marasmiellus scandens TaxID=2682957 RepID=A0ABR1K2D8_9AGAR